VGEHQFCVVSAIVGDVNLGPAELAIILVIVLVLFGGAKLPSLARSLGQAQKEFKRGLSEGITDDGDTLGKPENDV